MNIMFPTEPKLEEIRLDYLQPRNYYQRLGFNDIGPTSTEIEKACNARRRALKNAFNDLDKDEWTKARNLVEEAYECLIQPHRRRRYDEDLHRTITGVPNAGKVATSRYQVVQKLSEGDRTTIYEAHDTHLSRACIIKKINPNLLRNAEHRALIRREAELFASHNSGHLVKILDFDASRGIVVLERMTGSVSLLAKPSGTDPHLVYEWMEQALRGLDALHSQGLAHGRINHDHLLLDDRNQIKLSVTPGVSDTATALSPTAATKYVAPEMLNPSVFGKPGIAIDLYALGFVMLELLVGKTFAKKVNPGFSSKEGDSHGWLLWHASPTDHLPPVLELCPDISPSFAAVLEQMVVKDQNKRFTSASDCLCAMVRNEKNTAQELTRSDSRKSDTNDIRPIGSPDALTNTFQLDRSVTWKQLINHPRLLLSPDGRQHAAILVVGTLIACSLMLIMVSGSAEKQFQADNIKIEPERVTTPVDLNWEDALEDESREEVIPAATPETGVSNKPEPVPPKEIWRITFDVTGGGKVTAVDAIDKRIESEQWELLPGEHHATVVDSHGHATHNFTFTLAQGHGSMTIPIAQPTLEDVEHDSTVLSAPKIESDDYKVFHSTMLKMPIIGAANIEKATVQTELLRSALKNISRFPAGLQDEKYSIVLPDKPVDPRFAFALALRYYQLGEKTKALQLTQRAIEDAEHFGIVFLPIVQLRTRILMMRGNCMTALADCRSALSVLCSHRNRMSPEEISDAKSELAWWTGTLVGIIDNTHIDQADFNADTEYTSQYFEGSCSPENWQWFEAGRKRSTDQAVKLTVAWREYRSQKEDTMWDNQVQRFNRYGYRKDQKEKDRQEELDAYQMWLQIDSPLSEPDRYATDDQTPEAKTNAVDILVKPNPRFNGKSPNCFSSYVPDDTAVLAQRAYHSVAPPSPSQFIAIR